MISRLSCSATPATLQGVIGPEFFRDPDGSTWGISSSIGGVATAYNTAHFDKFGVNRLPEGGLELESDWTAVSSWKMAQELTNRGSTEADPVWGFFNNKQITGDVLSLLVQNGTNFLSDDYRRSRIHEPEFMEVVEFLHNLEFKWQVSPDPEAGSAFARGYTRRADLPRAFCLSADRHDELAHGSVRSLGRP